MWVAIIKEIQRNPIGDHFLKPMTLFFDLGNTLLYSLDPGDENIKIACVHAAAAFAELGYLIRPNDLAAAHYHNLTRYYAIRDGDHIEHSAEQIFIQTLEEFGFTDLPAKDIHAAIQAFYAYTQSNWYLIDGIPELLGKLRQKGHTLGLISNASSIQDVLTQLQSHRLSDFFTSVNISAAIGFRKPRREIFEAALKNAGVEAGDAVMIGDTFIADILGAKRMGMRAVWATRYAKTDQVILPDVHADFLLDDITLLEEVLDLMIR